MCLVCVVLHVVLLGVWNAGGVKCVCSLLTSRRLTLANIVWWWMNLVLTLLCTMLRLCLVIAIPTWVPHPPLCWFDRPQVVRTVLMQGSRLFVGRNLCIIRFSRGAWFSFLLT